MDTILGYIEHITYMNPENGYVVAKFKASKKKELLTIVGNMPSVQPGETIEITGDFLIHPKFGKQFKIESYRVKFPSDILGIQKYLESGLIKGIGPVYAEKIVNKFGLETLDVIDNSPNRLSEIDGIGPKRIELITKNWNEQKVIREVIIFLKTYNISPSFGQKIYKIYGEASIRVVKENPYVLAKEIHGIGFKTADNIAMRLGFEKESHLRIVSGIEYVLLELLQRGHSCFPKEDFLIIAEKMLEVESLLIQKGINTLLSQKEIVVEDLKIDQTNISYIWLKTFNSFEKNIAKELNRITSNREKTRKFDIRKALIWAEKNLNLKLADKQLLAVGQALEKKLLIITGGPGTGKSTITNVILRIFLELSSKIILCAPTGRAAKRLSQITKKFASTIHVLLEIDFKSGAFKRDENNPINCDMIIIDEASMIDTYLMHYLLKAIPSHAKVIFVGDVDQLPSVGAGNVLKDLIESEKVPFIYLNEIFRQAKNSQIIVNAHKINEGLLPDFSSSFFSDFNFYQIEEVEDIEKKIISLVETELPSKFKLDPFEDIQVLSPMRKGKIGIENLNQSLQNILNPSAKPLFRYNQRFHENDKVMQIKNNYQKNVFNGDIGRILKIDNIEQQLTVRFDEKRVIYEFNQLEELSLAYAVSVHKYQGSEAPCIIIPIHTTHFKLLYKNLLYTAITRGKKKVIILGTKKALAIAINNKESSLRHTGLKHFIQSTDESAQKTFFDI